MEGEESAPRVPGTGGAATLDAPAALAVLRTMWRIRAFEERVGALKRADEVYGLIHLSIGGEGVAGAVCSQLRNDDPAYTGHRGHGHAIAKGVALERAMAELMGRSDGLCRGFGGSMHLVDVDCGLMGATGVVGGNIPLALGSALAARLRGSDAVAVVFFGDGAVQAGHFNESVNLAALWSLPVILVCENNGMAEFTSREEHSVIERVSDVVAPYGITRETVDGNDVAALWEAFGRFLAAARGGGGPFLLECLTYRLRGHYEGDAGAVPRGDRGGGVAAARPDPETRAAGRRRGLVRRGRNRGCRERRARRGRGRRAVRACEPLSGPGAARAARLRAVSETTYVKAINAALAVAMRTDPRVFVMGEDVAEGGPYTATAGLAEEFGRERVRNTPISEGAICGVAIGAAQSGLRPVLEIMFIDFITLALDQLVNQAAKAHSMSGGQLEVPLVLRTQGGAGQRGGAQHSQSLEAWLTHVPGLKVVMPSNAADAAGLLASAIADPNPVVFVENKALYFKREELDDSPPAVPIGAAASVRSGGDVTIVALSRMVGEALAAAELLAGEGLQAEVIDPRTLVPLDLQTIVRSVERTGRLVVAHEAVALRRLWRGDRRGGGGRCLRFARRADRARRRPVHADPVEPAARGRLSARRDGDLRSSPATLGRLPARRALS